jgi:hypothetical protein
MFATTTLKNTDTAAVAVKRYEDLRWHAQIGQVWAAITRRARGLCALPEQMPSEQRYAGQKSVAIDEIRGSEGRATDFDIEFNPLRSATVDRWVSIFKARAQGKEMPPVDLVQYGDTYYVRDGHHRISVARARGEAFIDARVTLWR